MQLFVLEQVSADQVLSYITLIFGDRCGCSRAARTAESQTDFNSFPASIDSDKASSLLSPAHRPNHLVPYRITGVLPSAPTGDDVGSQQRSRQRASELTDGHEDLIHIHRGLG